MTKRNKNTKKKITTQTQLRKKQILLIWIFCFEVRLSFALISIVRNTPTRRFHLHENRKLKSKKKVSPKRQKNTKSVTHSSCISREKPVRAKLATRNKNRRKRKSTWWNASEYKEKENFRCFLLILFIRNNDSWEPCLERRKKNHLHNWPRNKTKIKTTIHWFSESSVFLYFSFSFCKTFSWHLSVNFKFNRVLWCKRNAATKKFQL